MLAGFRKRAEHAHHFMPIRFHDGLEVHRDAGLVLEDENSHVKRSNNPLHARRVPTELALQVLGDRNATTEQSGNGHKQPEFHWPVQTDLKHS